MKALVIGYGSIGARHAKILESLELDVFVFSRRKIEKFTHFKNLEEALSLTEAEYVVIANETAAHLNTLKIVKKYDSVKHILVEKPIFDISKNYDLTSDPRIKVAYHFRFHPLISKLKELLLDQKILSAHFYVGQYLPDWRPQVDYRKSYSASKILGGGVLRDLSHELDLALFLLGKCHKQAAIVGRFSDLEINVEDNVNIIGKYTNCQSVSLAMNYNDRLCQRWVNIVTNNNTYKLDFIKNELVWNNDSFKVILNKNEVYQKMHETLIEDSMNIHTTLEEGLEILKQIENIEKSSEDNKWIEN